MAKFKKHRFGHENPIFVHEERKMIAAVDRADESSSNVQIIGRNGELALADFLNRYLPNTMRVLNGHFVTPKGVLSPETDLMLLDTRYPLIAQNDDGSALAMLHSVIGAIEVKRTLNRREIQKIKKNSATIDSLQSEVFGDDGGWSSVLQLGFGYRTKLKIDTIEKHFFTGWESDPPVTLLYVLRILESDSPEAGKSFGSHLWFENRDYPARITTRSPLSDFYYTLVQCAYDVLGTRNYGFRDVSAHIMAYMTWGTVYAEPDR